MDSLEVNKACAAVLMAGIAFVGAGQIANVLVHPKPLHEAAIKIDVPEAAAPAPTGPTAPAAPIGVLLASADAGAGEAAIKKLCTACHNFDEGGKNGVGPNLYGVVGAPHGHLDNFQYSAALKSKEGPWTYDELNAWLTNPRGYAPGTKMAFAGISNDKQRADVIMYLRSLSKDPKPLPEPSATPAAAEGAAPAATGQGPANAPSNATETTPRPPQSGANAPTEGVTRPQPGQVVGPPGQSQVQSQQTTQPSPSLNESQTQTNQSQQPANAQQSQ